MARPASLARSLSVCVLAACAACAAASSAAEADSRASQPTSPADLFQLDLEALMDVKLKSAAGLTTIDLRRLPVAMSKIGNRDILESGLMDLNHLLEVYVPNTQFIDHHHLQPHLGFRGIISDREDKYLLQVNGRTMNNWMLLGADNERALPLLGDIRGVNVVRGPASATHGPGALAGVIDLETYDGLTFHGTDLALGHGVGRRYTTFEVRHGQKLAADRGLFVYYGVADVTGASSNYYIGRSFSAGNGLPANVAGSPLQAPMANLGAPGFDEPWHKLHASYVHGPFDFWVRFVQDGGQDRPMREIYTMTRPAGVSLEEWTRGRQFQSRQLTGSARFRKELSPEWNLELEESYDVWRFRDERAGVYSLPLRSAREDEIKTRATALWTPSETHSLAFGVDHSHVWLHDPAYSDTLDRAPVVTQRHWQANILSFMAENQWKINEQWTTFLSFRTDKHTYSPWLRSPRATIVYTPTERDTLKLMAGQSVRRGGDEELWAEWTRNRTIPKPESLRSYEISYERRWSDRWRAGGSVFYQNYDAIGWIPALYYSSAIGGFKIGGAELEVSYTSAKTRVTFSEGWSKLLKSKLPQNAPAAGQTVTAAPYGFGNDLAEWAPLITKLAVVRELGSRWSMSGSLVYYSGFPGASDYAHYAATLPVQPSAVPVSDPGYEEPYGPNLYVNLGLEYRPTRHWTLRVDGSNLAALADETLSKRNYYFRLSEFSVQPASVTFSARYRF